MGQPPINKPFKDVLDVYISWIDYHSLYAYCIEEKFIKP